MTSEFDAWWRNTGSGIMPRDLDDLEQHARTVAEAAWSAAVRGMQVFGHQRLHVSTLLSLYDQNDGDWLRIVRAVEKAHGVGV